MSCYRRLQFEREFFALSRRSVSLTAVVVILMLALPGISGFQLKQSLSNRQAESQTAESTSRALAAIESEIKDYIDAVIAREREQSVEPLSEDRVAEQVLARLESLIANGQLSVQPATPAPLLQAGPAPSEAAALVSAPVLPPGTEFAAVEPTLPEPAAPSGEVKIDQIHFLLNSTELTPGAQRKVVAAAEAIREASPREVRVIGFSDTVGRTAGVQSDLVGAPGGGCGGSAATHRHPGPVRGDQRPGGISSTGTHRGWRCRIPEPVRLDSDGLLTGRNLSL